MNMDEARPCSILASPPGTTTTTTVFRTGARQTQSTLSNRTVVHSTTPGPAFYRWRLSLRLAGHGGWYKPTRARFGQEKVSTLIPHRYVTPRITAQARGKGRSSASDSGPDRKEAQAEVQRGSGTTCHLPPPRPSLTVTHRAVSIHSVIRHRMTFIFSVMGRLTVLPAFHARLCSRRRSCGTGCSHQP